MACPTPRQWAGLVCGAAALALGLEWAIVTDAEAIEGQLGRLGAAMEARDADGALAVFDTAFAADDVDRAALGAIVAAALRTRVITSCAVDTVETTIAEDIATTRVEASVTARMPGGGGFPGRFHVTFRWGRGPDGWRIRGLAGEDPRFEAMGGIQERLPPARWLAAASRRLLGD